jgi:hypothetical protein
VFCGCGKCVCYRKKAIAFLYTTMGRLGQYSTCHELNNETVKKISKMVYPHCEVSVDTNGNPEFVLNDVKHTYELCFNSCKVELEIVCCSKRRTWSAIMPVNYGEIRFSGAHFIGKHKRILKNPIAVVVKKNEEQYECPMTEDIDEEETE